MTKEEKNKVDQCFDALLAMDLEDREDEWILFIDGEHVFSDKDEATVLKYAASHYPHSMPCLIRVPSKQPHAY